MAAAGFETESSKDAGPAIRGRRTGKKDEAGSRSCLLRGLFTEVVYP